VRGWIPFRVFWQSGRPMLDWCFLGEQRFTEPFFESTIQSLMLRPFHHVFRRETPLEEAGDWAAKSPGIPPSGFIFHSSRCGSTLVSRMLAAVDRNVVLSEPRPVDYILGAHFRHPEVTCEQRAEWFRWMVSALAQPRAGEEDGFFIKFDAWDIAELPIIRLAFPKTPWIFLYREPLEVFVSLWQKPAGWTFPGAVHPAVVGMAWDEIRSLRHNEYLARALGRIYRFGLVHSLGHAGQLVNYRQLPEYVCDGLLEYCGIRYSGCELDAMRSVTGQYAKSPGDRFTGDSRSKQEAAGDVARQLAASWIEPVYRELEAARQFACASGVR